MNNKETRDDIIQILKGRYSNVIRKGNTINLYVNLRSDERSKRISELENVYDFLKSSIKNRKVFYNKSSPSYSSIGHIEILEEYPPSVPKKLDEVRVTVKPSLLPELRRPGIQNELIFESIIKNTLSSSKIDTNTTPPKIIFKSSNNQITIEKATSVTRSSSLNPNDPIDITISSVGATNKISIKKKIFRAWTSAKRQKVLVKNALDDAKKKGGIILNGREYIFDPKSGFTAIAKKMSTSDIDKYILNHVDIILVSNFSGEDFIWNVEQNTLTVKVDQIYSNSTDLRNNAWLVITKSGNSTFNEYKNFNALFVPKSEVPNESIIVK